MRTVFSNRKSKQPLKDGIIQLGVVILTYSITAHKKQTVTIFLFQFLQVGKLRNELEGKRKTKDETSMSMTAGGVPAAGHPGAVMTKYETINI